MLINFQPVNFIPDGGPGSDNGNGGNNGSGGEFYGGGGGAGGGGSGWGYNPHWHQQQQHQPQVTACSMCCNLVHTMPHRLPWEWHQNF